MKNRVFLFLLCFTLAFRNEGFTQSSWKALPNAPPRAGRHEDVFFVNPLVGWVVNLSGEIHKTTDGGESWKTQVIGAPLRSVGFADALRGWVGTLNGDLIYQTQDGGATWKVAENISGPRPAGICGISVVNASVVYGSGRYDGTPSVIKTINGGVSWTAIDMSAHAGTLIDCYFLTPESGFVVGGSPQGTFPATIRAVILFTNDGGRTWQTRFTSSTPGEWAWKISFPSLRTGYVSIERPGAPTSCVKTTDTGLTWEEILVRNLALDAQGIGFATENVGWIAGRGLPYETVDGGRTWRQENFGEAINRFRLLNDSLGYAVGRTIYKYSPSRPTSVSSRREEEPPRAYELAQNYPNPFNPQTTIKYSLQKTGWVELQVYDLSGKIIATLANEVKPAGHYETSFEAFGIPTGIYFYRLRTRDFVQTRKMLIAK